jgi:hypothetical protein
MKMMSVLAWASMGCVLVVAGGAAADAAADLDAKAREATGQIISIVQEAAAQSRTFAEASKSIERSARSRSEAERERGSATAGMKVAQTAAKEEGKYRRSGGKNKQALKSALGAYDRAIVAATRLTVLEATVAANDKGVQRELPRLESSAKKIKTAIGSLNKAVASLDRTVRLMKAKKVNPNLVAQWERQLAKAKADRDQIAALRPVLEKRVKELRKLAAVPPSAAAAKKKIAEGNARHSRALAKLESLEAKRAILAMEEDKTAGMVARAGTTFDDCDVRKVDWKNFEYFAGRGGTLRNGETHWETDYESHDVSFADVVYADLDGDSEDEAYVWITDWLDWAEVGTMGSEDLYIFTVDATCRLLSIGGASYWQDVEPGKIVGKRYVVTDPFENLRVEWFFKDGELTSVKKPLEN